MGEEGEAEMVREEGEEDRLTMETLITALREVSRAGQAVPGDRYRLRPPIFGGDGDVEQFIREFEEVATLAEWPVQVRLLQLRTCLTGPAKSYALGPDVGHIFQALRSRFGLTARAARDRLRTIRRDRKTSLQDHANAIEALAQVAHGNDEPEAQRSAVYEAFFHTINNPGLQRYYLAAKVTTIEEALALGKAYYQVDGPQCADFTANQVEEQPEVIKPAPPNPQVVAAATATPSPDQMTMLMDMVKGLQADMKQMQQEQADRRAPRPRGEPIGTSHLTCWGCGARGHVQRQCPQGRRVSLNTRGSR